MWECLLLDLSIELRPNSVDGNRSAVWKLAVEALEDIEPSFPESHAFPPDEPNFLIFVFPTTFETGLGRNMHLITHPRVR